MVTTGTLKSVEMVHVLIVCFMLYVVIFVEIVLCSLPLPIPEPPPPRTLVYILIS